MLGATGTQVASKTLFQSSDYRIDVENPNPGQRPGQLHLQDNNGNKYLYDFATGRFEGLPNSVAKNLYSIRGVQSAIIKGARYLGVK
jgi:hypothetical protein